MEITIGKFTLETLTSGMYERPKDIYREYIQNAADSIDVAISGKLIKRDASKIEIKISKEEKWIKIYDNGTGINSMNAIKYLLDIGRSQKRFTGARGFRGIGRLAGLAYCKMLSFETTSFGENKKTIVEFDAKVLCEQMLNESFDVDLLSLLKSSVSVRTETESKNSHYFCVIMSRVVDVDDILDVEKVKQYLEQVAPVDFNKLFNWGKIVKSKLRVFGFEPGSYNVAIGNAVNKESLFKSYSDIIISDRLRKLEDSVAEIDIKEFIFEGGPLAYLWYAKSNFFGTLQDELIKCIRLRKGNILIGDKTTLNHIFKDERFNGWLFGELHVVSDKLIPNARRDELEKNAAYYSLIRDLKVWADGISTEIRKVSNQRNSDKKSQKIIEFANNQTTAEIETINTVVVPEVKLAEETEIDELNHTELVMALDGLIGIKQSSTKYKALNIQSHITIEQKKILEQVFDIICSDKAQNSNILITKIIREFGIKTVTGI